MSEEIIARLQFKVRDYECDMQGVVNNAVYQNYYEHARHEYLFDRGFDFAEITRSGIHLVVIRAEIDYKKPLKSGDCFVVVSAVERLSKLKFCFMQSILSEGEELKHSSAKITCASLNALGRPSYYPHLECLF